MQSPLAAALEPLTRIAVERVSAWLPKLSRPIRTGEHSQTAFALGLMIDYARGRRDKAFAALLESRARDYYLQDRACPLSYEPGGQDFLSPCLAEADVMRRVLPAAEYTRWLTAFLPQRAAAALTPAVVTDPTDGQLAHLDGLNLSRAWMLEGIASALPAGRRRAPLERVAALHRDAGLRAVSGQHYEGAHWLGTFAMYLSTRRGL
jgi:hypothetical protein